MFYYNNDVGNTVHAEALFIDETPKYPHGDCAAILPDTNEISKFYLHAVNCTVNAQVLCRANVTIPPTPGENLPKIPCVQTASRKKRQTSSEEGIYRIKYNILFGIINTLTSIGVSLPFIFIFSL